MKVLRELGIFLLFVIAWGGMFYPALFYLHEGFLGGVSGDPAAYIYYVIHNINRIITLPSAGYDGNYFYPFGNTLSFSDNFILPALLAKPIYLISGNYSLAYNTIMSLAPITSGYLTFCLVRYITSHFAASFFAGFAFMCLPFIYGHLGHPQLQYAFGLPAIILACLWFAETRKPLAATLIGFIVFIQFFSTVYYSLISYLLAALILSSYALLRIRSINIKDITILIALNLPWLILTYLTTEPYMAVRDAFLPWPTELIRRLSGNFSSYLSFSRVHLLWGPSTQKLALNGAWLGIGFTVLFLSITTITKLVLGKTTGHSLFAHNTIKRLIALLITTSIIALFAGALLGYENLNLNQKSYLISIPMWLILLSTIGYLVLAGLEHNKDLKLKHNDYIYLFLFLTVFFLFASLGIISRSGNIELYNLMHNYLPGFNGLRAAYRFGIVTALMLMLISALTLSKFKPIVALLALFLVAAEYKTRPYRSSRTHKQPKVYQRLAKIPGQEAVISLPFSSPLTNPAYPRMHTKYMLWTAPTLRPMMSGWSSKLPLYYQFKGKQIDTFPQQKSLNTLGQVVGLKYLVYNRRFFPNFNRKQFYADIKNAGEQIEIIHLNRKNTGLFRLKPHLILNDVKYPELYMPPDTKNSRTLKFEVMSTAPHQLKITSDKNFQQILTLDGQNTWQPFEVVLPPSAHSVKPHKLIFHDLPNSKVIVREAKLHLASLNFDRN